MRKVNKKEFWTAIGSQDVHPRIVGSFPYTSDFATRSGVIKGRIVESLPRVNGACRKEYYLIGAWA